MYLRVTADKRVAGTTNPFDPSGMKVYLSIYTFIISSFVSVTRISFLVVFDLIPAGRNSIKIQNVKSGLYVAIDQNGDIVTKVSSM